MRISKTFPPAVALLLAAVVSLAFAQQSAPPATSIPPVVAPKPAIEPRAIEILKAMSDKLASAKNLSFVAHGAFDVPAANGQPLFYMTQTEVTLQRPDKLKVIAASDGSTSEFFYDGKTIAVFMPKENVVAVADAPGNIEAMLEMAYDQAGIYFPFVDVIVADPYETLTGGLTSAFVIGQTKLVGGTTTDIVALANDEVQAQIWIDTQDKLPRLIWVTATKMPERPRHSVEFTDWKLNAAVDPGAFMSADASKAAKIEFARPDATDTQ
jgi:hypothetical protein